MSQQTMRWGVGASVAGAALLALSALGLSPATGQNGPPGNNGTVKIDGVAFDDHPNNEPHVGCTFQVDFTGFDAAQPEHVEFALQSPTLAPGTQQNDAANILLTDDVVVDGNGEADVTYDLAAALDASDATPHEVQGFHVKLTITSDNLPGNGTKHKVFWVECEVPTPPTTAPPTTAPPTTAPPTTAPPTTAPPGAPTPQAPAPPAGRAPTPAAPQAPAAAPTPSGQLAFTGSSTSILAGVGVVLLLVGAGLTLLARRRFAT
jgi:hypothetical protein